MANLSLAIGEHFFRLAVGNHPHELNQVHGVTDRQYYANGTSLDYIDPISVIYNGT